MRRIAAGSSAFTEAAITIAIKVAKFAANLGREISVKIGGPL